MLKEMEEWRWESVESMEDWWRLVKRLDEFGVGEARVWWIWEVLAELSRLEHSRMKIFWSPMHSQLKNSNLEICSRAHASGCAAADATQKSAKWTLGHFRGAAAHACSAWHPKTCVRVCSMLQPGAAACSEAHGTQFSAKYKFLFLFFASSFLLLSSLQCPYKDVNKPNNKCNRTFTINTRELTTFLDNMCLQILSYN